jgi:cytochrome c oxidase assembly factor CtaG
MLPPLTVHRWLTGWSAAPGPLVLAAALAGGYLLAVRRRDEPWPISRTAWFLVAGVGSLLVTTQSFLGTYDRTRFWPLAVQDVLLLTVVPLGLTLGRPLELLGPRARLPRPLDQPLVGSLLSVGALLAVYTTGWDAARLDSPVLLAATQWLLVGLGCLTLWPLLGADQGTGTTSYPVRLLVALLDGLLDAIPGLVILGSGTIAAAHYGPTAHHDQVVGGTAMVALSELAGLPALLGLLVLWVRSHDREAVELDAQLDARLEVATSADVDKPWWESDPGPLGDRFR